jgi:hypothetical protein
MHGFLEEERKILQVHLMMKEEKGHIRYQFLYIPGPIVIHGVVQCL